VCLRPESRLNQFEILKNLCYLCACVPKAAKINLKSFKIWRICVPASCLTTYYLLLTTITYYLKNHIRIDIDNARLRENLQKNIIKIVLASGFLGFGVGEAIA
jgi:hypothetical protein